MGHVMANDQVTDERTVAFLGGGRMGEALVSGLIRSGGRSAGEIAVTARREERVRELADRLPGVMATISNPDAVRWAQTIVLTVKPQDMQALLEEIRARSGPTSSSSRSPPASGPHSSNGSSRAAPPSCG